MRAIRFVAILAAALVCAGGAYAQPTPEQQAAVKANCRSDFMSNCMGVPRGGSEAFQCLKQNLAKLSPGCKQAVSAIGVKPPTQAAAKPAVPTTTPAAVEPAPAPAPAATEKATPSAPTPAAATAPAPAVKEQAAPAAKQTVAPAPQPTPTPTPKKAIAAPIPAPAPPPQEKVIVVAPRQVFALVRTSCRAEYRAYCSEVEKGGGRVVACLQANAASLSPTCKEALAALAR